MSDITSKKKIVVDEDIFLDLSRNEQGQINASLPFYLGALYLPYDNKDTARVALGKHWDFDFKANQEDSPGGAKIFKGPSPTNYEQDPNYSNAKINVFCDSPLQLISCEDLGSINVDDPTMGGTQEKIVLKCQVPYQKFSSIFESLGLSELALEDDQLSNPDGGTSLAYWTYLMQYGIVDPAGATLTPIVKINRAFSDHYYEAAVPFTPDELANSQTGGKTFFADYDVFYNNRASSGQQGITNTSYESFISDPRYQNSLPNVYSFVKVLNNPGLAEEQIFDIGEIVDGGDDGHNTYVPNITLEKFYNAAGSSADSDSRSRLRNDTYAELLQYYPLEASLLLYGSLYGLPQIDPGQVLYQDNPLQSNVVIEQLLKLDAKKTDATALFNLWLNNFKLALQNDPALKKMNTLSHGSEGPYSGRYGFNPSTKLGSLEYINSNLAFSPSVATNMMKSANKYKDYFPMYFELNFTAQLATSIGDTVHQLKMGRFLADKASALQHAYGYGPGSDFVKFNQDDSQPLSFVDYTEKKMNINYNPADPTSGKATFLSIPGADNSDYQINSKRTIDILSAINDYMSSQDYSSTVVHPLLNVEQPIPPPAEEAEPWYEQDGISGQGGDNDEGQILYKSDLQSMLTGQGPVKAEVVTPEDAAAAFTAAEAPQAALDSYDDPHLVTEVHPPPLWLKDSRNYLNYIRDDIEEPPSLVNIGNAIYKALGPPLLKAKIISTYEKNKRSYEEIIKGIPAHTEDLLYVIKKFRKNVGQTEEINVQNIIIPNTSELDIVQYVDTQVKYGADAVYRYEVFAYRIVFGSRYVYELEQGAYKPGASSTSPLDPAPSDGSISNLENLAAAMASGQSPGSHYNTNGALFFDNTAASTKDYTATYVVKTYPSIQLIEDKIFSTPDVRILDDPPVPPHVDVVPFRAVNNKIKIILAGSTDTFRAKPVILLDGDEQMFAHVKQSQFSYDDKVRFSSDDKISGFQIFRIEQRPESYEDFTLHPDAPSLNGGSAALDDSILPNKKYYYTFRAVDNHGHISNPTPVYEVELIDEKGAVKPIIRTISMEKKEDKVPVKECQKYILLKPTDKQLYFSDNPDMNVNSVFSTEDATNRKKYKLRLTSKGTGKRIDINFTFFKNFKQE